MLSVWGFTKASSAPSKRFSGKILFNLSKKSPTLVFKKSYQWKRNLVEHAFGGRYSKKQRLEVYVEETGDAEQPWRFEIRGLLDKTLLSLPLSDEYLEDSFHLDYEYHDIQLELQKIRSKITNCTWS